MSIDRRTFIKLGGAGVAGVAFASLLAGCEEYIVTPIGTTDATTFITPVDRFFVQNGGQGSIEGWTRPTLSQGSWTLNIDGFNPGDAATPLVVTYNDLLDAASAGHEITMLKTIQCVLESPLRLTPTGFMGNAYWTGVPLNYFLDKAGLSDKVKRVLLYGADGFTNNLTIDRLKNGAAQGLIEPLLVYRMNGAPLSDEHGFPVRLIVQEGFGYKNVKWITKVVATKFDVEFGTYQDQGFVDDGVIRVNSRSTTIREGSTIPAGPTEITGFAVSGFAPVLKVEIRIDDGPYRDATIVGLEEIAQMEGLPSSIEQFATGLPFPFRAVWSKWRFTWDAPGGEHTIYVRATDALGNLQPEQDTFVSDGQTGVARYTVKVE
jgi:DMSO/TMAO reductase YedYZ molybdopterin-dependent catalytic subunit